MNTKLSSSTHCDFVIQFRDEIKRLETETGAGWENEGFSPDLLHEFSQAASCFDIEILCEGEEKLLVFIPRDFSEDRSIRIFPETRFGVVLPCAFFDQDTKKYEEFCIPEDAEMIEISADVKGRILVNWGEREPEYEEPEDCLPFWDDAQNVCDENDDMMKEVSGLELENQRLLRVISQLADREFSEEFELTLDQKIDDILEKIRCCRERCAEKQTSLKLLEDELASAVEEENGLNLQIDDAAGKLQKAPETEDSGEPESDPVIPEVGDCGLNCILF